MKTVWFWPIIIAILSTTGLLVGLIFDDLGDMFAGLALGIPVAVSAWYGWYKRPPAG